MHSGVPVSGTDRDLLYCDVGFGRAAHTTMHNGFHLLYAAKRKRFYEPCLEEEYRPASSGPCDDSVPPKPGDYRLGNYVQACSCKQERDGIQRQVPEIREFIQYWPRHT